VTGAIGKGYLESSLGVILVLADEDIGCLIKVFNNFRINICKFLDDLLVLCFDHIILRWNWHSLEFYLSKLFNPIKELNVLVVEKGDADTTLAHSSCSARSVDVALCVLWWFELDDKFNVWDV